MNRNLGLSLVRVTENAAIACAKWMGRGDKDAADQSAVNGMRLMFDTIEIDGEVVIGEGEKDEAPMLYIGERIGKAGIAAPQVDIAVDPLDGTTSTAKGIGNAISVIAVAPRGQLFRTKVFYMEKIAVGPEAKGAIDLNKPLKQNLISVAEATGKRIEELTVSMLERDRHNDLIKECRELGCRIKLFRDGDVGGAIATCMEESGVDVMTGIGGAPEGVLAAAAIKCLGGEMQGRLYAKTEEEKLLKEKQPDMFERILTLDDLVQGDAALFVATGVTDGDMLRGVRYLPNNVVKTHSVVMRSETGTIRFVEALHHMDRKPAYAQVSK
ncbi:MAG TPA: class II fructose-bisphosphatase [Clostridiales bacterium]|jgi:fructose-1,6-bisphosphatase II|nr:class II fructose-bisphosphatase [Clostridiales bacterium]